MSNNYLVVVDMQNDFIDGALGTEEARAAVPAVVQRIKYAKALDWNIYCTKDTHYDEDYLSTQEGRKLPVKHCVFGTHGHELNSDVENALDGHLIHIYPKNTFGSLCMAKDILAEVRDSEQKEGTVNIELIGLCTDICVLSNAILLKAFLPEANITVRASCCAGVTPELHEAALKAMNSCQINIA